MKSGPQRFPSNLTLESFFLHLLTEREGRRERGTEGEREVGSEREEEEKNGGIVKLTKIIEKNMVILLNINHT